MKLRRLEMAAALLVFVMVRMAVAQQGLVVQNLSAKPRLQECGEQYDVEVRFTTNIAAITRLRYGTDQRCEQVADATMEPRRNHRFDIANVPIGQKRWVRVAVAAEGQPEAVGELTEIDPPKPFPVGSATRLSIGLTVTETEGVARSEPVTFGVPLPEGTLGRSEMVRLVDGSAPIPIATRALSRWPDGTIKWLLVTGRLSVDQKSTRQLTLEIGSDVQPSTVRGRTMIHRQGDTFVVDTGASRLVIDEQTGQGTFYLGDRLVSKLPVSRLTTTDGTSLLGTADAVEVEEDSPLRAVIKVRGHHVNESGEPYFGFVFRYYCHADDPLVRVDHVLQHDIVDPEHKYGDEMKSFASLDLLFDTGEGGMQTRVVIEEGESVDLPTGKRLFQHFDDQYLMGEQKGRRAAGQASQDALVVAVRDFWQQWPKGLAAEDGRLVVGLYPSIKPTDRYANRPDEVTTYYYLRDGNYTFRSGFEKRHEVWMGPAGTIQPAEMRARVNAPLLVTADPAWYTSSGALLGIAADDPKEFAAYDEVLAQGIDDYFTIRESRHWYGLMNYGDVQGGRARSWANIEYDLQHGLLTQYFRTGDRRFFLAGEQAARHNADIDVVHYAAGQRAGPGRKREVGQAWVHCMGHTGGYYPYDYKGLTIYAQGYAENEGHMWNQGNLEYYLLTGDEQVRQSAMQLADWAAGPNTTNFGYGNARVPGWMGIIAMSTYFATYDEYYLNAMRLMYEEVQEKGDPKHGLWIHKLSGGHCRCEESHHGEAGFMSGVLMTALKYFYLATGDEEVAERIVRIARYQVDQLWEPTEGAFRYTSCPETGSSPILSLIMANGLAFAANHSGDKQLAAIAREAFANGLIAFRSRGPGNGIVYGLPICAAPLAIHEISHFSGSSMNEYLERLQRAALNPARRSLPSLVPNPDFEQNLDGWTIRGDLEFSRSTEVVHTGKSAAMAAGQIQSQGEYFVTRYDCGPPWEPGWLERGKTYRLQLWLRVDKIGANVPAPRARVQMRSLGRSREAFQTNRYDTSQMGTWQRLQTELVVPEYYDGLYIAINTETREPQQDVLMYLDDVTIVPADAPEQMAYVYPASQAAEAKLIGGLELVADGTQRSWQTITSPHGEAGAAEWSIEVSCAGNYRLVVRAKSPGGNSDLGVHLDGKPAGVLRLKASEDYDWITSTMDPAKQPVQLNAGTHRLKLDYPAGQPAAVQKVCLTNELLP